MCRAAVAHVDESRCSTSWLRLRSHLMSRDTLPWMRAICDPERNPAASGTSSEPPRNSCESPGDNGGNPCSGCVAPAAAPTNQCLDGEPVEGGDPKPDERDASHGGPLQQGLVLPLRVAEGEPRERELAHAPELLPGQPENRERDPDGHSEPDARGQHDRRAQADVQRDVGSRRGPRREHDSRNGYRRRREESDPVECQQEEDESAQVAEREARAERTFLGATLLAAHLEGEPERDECDPGEKRKRQRGKGDCVQDAREDDERPRADPLNRLSPPVRSRRNDRSSRRPA